MTTTTTTTTLIKKEPMITEEEEEEKKDIIINLTNDDNDHNNNSHSFTSGNNSNNSSSTSVISNKNEDIKIELILLSSMHFTLNEKKLLNEKWSILYEWFNILPDFFTKKIHEYINTFQLHKFEWTKITFSNLTLNNIFNILNIIINTSKSYHILSFLVRSIDAFKKNQLIGEKIILNTNTTHLIKQDDKSKDHQNNNNNDHKKKKAEENKRKKPGENNNDDDDDDDDKNCSSSSSTYSNPEDIDLLILPNLSDDKEQSLLSKWNIIRSKKSDGIRTDFVNVTVNTFISTKLSFQEETKINHIVSTNSFTKRGTKSWALIRI